MSRRSSSVCDKSRLLLRLSRVASQLRPSGLRSQSPDHLREFTLGLYQSLFITEHLDRQPDVHQRRHMAPSLKAAIPPASAMPAVQPSMAVHRYSTFPLRRFHLQYGRFHLQYGQHSPNVDEFLALGVLTTVRGYADGCVMCCQSDFGTCMSHSLLRFSADV